MGMRKETDYPAPSRVQDRFGKYLYVSGREWDRGASSQTCHVVISRFR